MRVGVITRLNGRPGGTTPPPTWSSVAALAQAAEEVSFDVLVYEDALLYRGEKHTDGVWESMAISAGLAVATERIAFGPSVVNSPYRSPALLAKIAETLDEMSGGRFVLGIGAGNTPDNDYEAFGFPTDKRYSRFAETIEIVHTLLKTGGIDFSGDFYSAKQAELVLRGPSGNGPRINIAARGPKMLRLAARFADEWNWWVFGGPVGPVMESLEPILAELDEACLEIGRDPTSLTRTLDLYSVVPPGIDDDVPGVDEPVAGSVDEIVAFIAALGEQGFTEVRCDLAGNNVAAVEAMAPVVSAVHDL